MKRKGKSRRKLELGENVSKRNLMISNHLSKTVAPSRRRSSAGAGGVPQPRTRRRGAGGGGVAISHRAGELPVPADPGKRSDMEEGGAFPSCSSLTAKARRGSLPLPTPVTRPPNKNLRPRGLRRVQKDPRHRQHLHLLPLPTAAGPKARLAHVASSWG